MRLGPMRSEPMRLKADEQNAMNRSTNSPATRSMRYLGQTLSRTAAKRAVAGRGRYTDDAFLPSPYAHARILGLEVEAARQQPGVALVLTGADLKALCTGPWIGTLSTFAGMKSAPQYAMAVERACWAGEPVAMVVARTRAEAEDAVEAIGIEWQELPAVVDKHAALAPGAPVIHAELGDNLAFRRSIDT